MPGFISYIFSSVAQEECCDLLYRRLLTKSSNFTFAYIQYNVIVNFGQQSFGAVVFVVSRLLLVLKIMLHDVLLCVLLYHCTFNNFAKEGEI